MNKQEMANYNSTLKRFMEENTGNFTTEELEEILKTLHRYETTLRRLALIPCNDRPLTEAEQKKETSIENKVKKIAEKLGFNVRFNSDPRGYAIRFILPSSLYNQLDGETWALNW